jgi:hypothetical protein
MEYLNVSQGSGYSLVNENIRILSEQWKVSLAILDGLNLPVNTVVILQTLDSNNKLCYCSKTSTSASYILKINLSDTVIYNIQNNNASYRVIVNSQSVNIQNSLGSFPDAYRIETGSVAITNADNRISVMSLDDAVRLKSQNPSKTLDLSQCAFYNGSTLGFDAQDNITGVIPLGSQWTTFVGNNNSIERIGNYLKLNFTFSGSPAGGGTGIDAPKTIIELPAGFVNFTKITRIKASLIAASNVNIALENDLKAVIYKRYIIMYATTGTAHSVVDYIPIV